MVPNDAEVGVPVGVLRHDAEEPLCSRVVDGAAKFGLQAVA